MEKYPAVRITANKEFQIITFTGKFVQITILLSLMTALNEVDLCAFKHWTNALQDEACNQNTHTHKTTHENKTKTERMGTKN